MSTITLTLEADADGTVHVPVPPELRNQKLKVTASIEPLILDPERERRRVQDLNDLMERIRAKNPFRDIEDPVAWQREMREDRELPFRD